jgi:predicted nucleic acid-binding protein
MVIRRVFDAVADDGALVPALWRLEVANSLTMAVRRRRIDPDFRRAALADLALLDITTEQQTDSYAWTDTLNLADRFQLTVYDAAYLELAQRRALPLATLDQDLRNAAMAIGVEVLGTNRNDATYVTHGSKGRLDGNTAPRGSVACSVPP